MKYKILMAGDLRWHTDRVNGFTEIRSSLKKHIHGCGIETEREETDPDHLAI